MEARSLSIGTSSVSRAGPQLSVQGVSWHRAQALAGQSLLASKPYTVYNLTVEDDHTFFVGTSGGGTWVHNTCVYQSVDSAGETNYTGITDNFPARAAAHLREKGINIKQIPGLENLARADA